MDLTNVVSNSKTDVAHAISELEAHGNFCIHCGRAVAYKVIFTPVTFNVGNTEVLYKEASAICMDCNNEIYVPEVNDKNVNARRIAYFKARRGGY